MTQVPKEVYFLPKLCARNVKKPLIIISSSKNPSLMSVIPFIETQNVAAMAPAQCYVCNSKDNVHFTFPSDPSRLKRWCILLKYQIPETATGKSGPRLCADHFSRSDIIEQFVCFEVEEIRSDPGLASQGKTESYLVQHWKTLTPQTVLIVNV